MQVKESLNKKYIIIFFSGVFIAILSIGLIVFIMQEQDYKEVKIDGKEVTRSITNAGKIIEKEEQKREEEVKENQKIENSTNHSNPDVNTNQESTSASDSEIVNYFLEQERYASNSEQDSSLRERLKNGVSTIYQFLFHGGTIYGKTFKELSSSAKLQVLKIALSIDFKIDQHFPNYKEYLKQETSNLKSKIIITYLETTNKICTDYEDVCHQAREDFKTMKNSFKISFSLIAGLAKEGSAAIKEWYLSTK